MLLAGLLGIGGTAACGNTPPSFDVVPGNADTDVAVQGGNDQTVIEIRSQSGIGSAEVRLRNGRPPRRIVLRLYLRGLEQVRFGYDNTVVTVAIGSTQGNPIRQSVRTPTLELDVAPDSPYWMPARIVSHDAIPLTEGYFELDAPAHFVKGGYRSFAIQWVDFFR